MKSKVTLRELVGTKIIYALLLTAFYWMWARRDWHDYYQTIQLAISIFTVLFFSWQAMRISKYNKEEKDELAISNLRRVDSLCFKIMIVLLAVIAFASVFIEAYGLPGSVTGYALVFSLLLLSVIRFVAFCIMDSKGI